MGEVNQQSIYPVIVHWAEDTFGRGQPAEYIPSDSTHWARSTSRYIPSTLGRGYLWARSTSRVYTLVHWAEDGEVNQQSIYPVIVHWAEDTFGRGQPAEYIPSDSTLGRDMAKSTSRVYTQ